MPMKLRTRLFLQKLLGRAGYEVRRVQRDGLPLDLDPFTRSVISRVTPFTMTSPERIAALCASVNYIVANEIPGAIVECGVWKGGSMMAVALELLRLGAVDRKLYLFDTFEGMSEPTQVDRRPGSGDLAIDMLRVSDKTSTIWAVAPIDEVKRNLASTGYNPEHIQYVQGKVEDTLPCPSLGPIALLRLDTDWYESTRQELNTLFPKLAPGGILIIDDYGAWEGARQAVDEYIDHNHLKLLLHRIDETGRLAIKPLVMNNQNND